MAWPSSFASVAHAPDNTMNVKSSILGTMIMSCNQLETDPDSGCPKAKWYTQSVILLGNSVYDV